MTMSDPTEELTPERQERLRQLTEAAEERARILADPTRAEPVLRPERYADPIGFDEEGRPLPGHRRGQPSKDDTTP
jgi:hypothetical protein